MSAQFIRSTENTLLTLVGKELDLDVMVEAQEMAVAQCHKIQADCWMSEKCGAIAVQEVFGDAKTIARIDTFGVSCDVDMCPMKQEANWQERPGDSF